MGPAIARLEHRRPYATRDGYLCVLVYNDKQWKSFLEAIGRPELMKDQRFATQANRAEHIDEIYDFLADLMKDAHDRRMDGAAGEGRHPRLADEHGRGRGDRSAPRASGFFSAEEHPSEGRLRAMRTPTDWSDSPPGSAAARAAARRALGGGAA